MNGSKRILIVTVALATLAFGQVALGCPTCGNSIEHSGGNLAEGFYWSILFMMSMPFVILGGLTLLCWLEVRKARRAAAVVAASCAMAGSSSRAESSYRSSRQGFEPAPFGSESVTTAGRP